MTLHARFLAAAAAAFLWAASASSAKEPGRITIVYDAFGAPSALVKDWGFAAFVEYGGRRVLFDTGNDAKIFEHNVAQLGIDLERLDAVVISHRHGDHTSGLGYLLARNPTVRIYTPHEPAYFGSTLPSGFLEPHPGLPADLRYFDGQPPGRRTSGTPWESARFETVTAPTEILPGFYLLTTRSQKPGTLEMNEVSLAIRTPKGLAVIVGCSHPGVEQILAEAAKIDSRIFIVAGGLHLVQTSTDEIERVAGVLQDTFRVERVAPGHCTSERGFATFLDRFEDRFDRAGLGSVILLP